MLLVTSKNYTFRLTESSEHNDTGEIELTATLSSNEFEGLNLVWVGEDIFVETNSDQIDFENISRYSKTILNFEEVAGFFTLVSNKEKLIVKDGHILDTNEGENTLYIN